MGVPCCCCCPFSCQCVKETGEYFCQLFNCAWPFLKPHFDYWWCYDDNIKNLESKIQYLECQIYHVQQEIDAARRNAGRIRPEVQKWLEESTDMLVEARTALPNDNIPEAWKLFPRYSMGKRAKKALEKIANHQNYRSFTSISDRALPACMAPTSQEQTMDFDSRKLIEENIMESLKDSSISTIAICGIVGVGKTTMAERIKKRWKEENKLDEVVKVVVGQQAETQEIQKKIAEELGLTLNVDTTAARAHLLRTRLMNTERKIIIFDDVRESLNLKDFGISFDSHFEGCKILLTTRSKNFFREMGAVKVIEINMLTIEEAWSLFKATAGQEVEEPELHDVAKDIVEKCHGLPIALVEHGKNLKIHKKYVFENFLSELKGCSSPTKLPEVQSFVYKQLKLSYNCLNDENEKRLLLLCCLFPENYNIPVQQLCWYSMGLQRFDYKISVAKNKTLTLVDNIKRQCLLIDGHQELHVKRQRLLRVKSQELHVEMPGHHVKMHSFVRDLAISIGSEEKNGFLKILNKMPIEGSSDDQCRWMSVDISNEGMEFPVGLCFPKLRHLMLLRSNFSDITFKETKILNVLSFPSTSIGSLPRTLRLLKNLRTLCLLNCQVENISVIGELTSLKILSCYGCKNITELPVEIGGLNSLRLLELYECSNLQRIPSGIISRLVQLEELKIRRSFSEWDTGGERRNAALKELESLPNLTCLEIEISDCSLAGQMIGFLKELDKYYIRIGPIDYYYSQEGDYENVMILNLPSHNDVVGQWIQNQVNNTAYLSLKGDGSNKFKTETFENLRNLRFQSCSTVKKLVNSNSGTAFRWLKSLTLCQLKEFCTIPLGLSNSFENLEELHVSELPKLIKLWESPNLRNLKSINIKSCSNLLHVFPESMAGSCLSQLEVLEVQNCDKLKQVFGNEITGDPNVSIEFAKLKILKLRDLPNLTVFWQGIKIIKFPNLTEMLIGGLPNLNSFSPLNSETTRDDTTSFHFLCNPKVWFEMLIGGLPNPLNSETPHDDTTSFHFLCNPKVEMGSLKTLSLTGSLKDNISNIWCRQIPPNFFDKLRELKIYRMYGIKSLLTYPIAKNFVNLRSLDIKDCKVMVEVIKADAVEAVDHMPLLFPTLKLLSITKLLELRSFWPVQHTLALPLLEYVDIKQCPVMNTFTIGWLETPKIRKIDVNNHQIDDQKDLNWVLQKYNSKQNNDEDNRDKNNNEIVEDEDEDAGTHLIPKRRKRENNGEDNRDKNNNEIVEDEDEDAETHLIPRRRKREKQNNDEDNQDKNNNENVEDKDEDDEHI